VCNFLDAPELVFPSASTSTSGGTSGEAHGADGKGKGRAVGHEGLGEEDDTRVIYRHYATLYFVYVPFVAQLKVSVRC
jgi:AP-3 complex subunit sigma